MASIPSFLVGGEGGAGADEKFGDKDVEQMPMPEGHS